MRTRNSPAWRFVFLGLLMASTLGGNQKEYLYLQPSTAELRAEPKMNAPATGTLKRGDRVSVLNKQDKWLEVRFSDKRGWIPAYFMTATKPIGQAELAKDIPSNLEKASRRRPPSYTVSAATRGLAGEAPQGKGRGKADGEGEGADYRGLQQLEGKKPQAADLESFRSSAKLKAP